MAVCKCPGCSKSYTVSAEKLGKTVRCKACGHSFVLAAPAQDSHLDSLAALSPFQSTAQQPHQPSSQGGQQWGGSPLGQSGVSASRSPTVARMPMQTGRSSKSGVGGKLVAIAGGIGGFLLLIVVIIIVRWPKIQARLDEIDRKQKADWAATRHEVFGTTPYDQALIDAKKSPEYLAAMAKQAQAEAERKAQEAERVAARARAVEERRQREAAEDAKPLDVNRYAKGVLDPAHINITQGEYKARHEQNMEVAQQALMLAPTLSDSAQAQIDPSRYVLIGDYLMPIDETLFVVTDNSSIVINNMFRQLQGGGWTGRDNDSRILGMPTLRSADPAAPYVELRVTTQPMFININLPPDEFRSRLLARGHIGSTDAQMLTLPSGMRMTMESKVETHRKKERYLIQTFTVYDGARQVTLQGLSPEDSPWTNKLKGLVSAIRPAHELESEAYKRDRLPELYEIYEQQHHAWIGNLLLEYADSIEFDPPPGFGRTVTWDNDEQLLTAFWAVPSAKPGDEAMGVWLVVRPRLEKIDGNRPRYIRMPRPDSLSIEGELQQPLVTASGKRINTPQISGTLYETPASGGDGLETAHLLMHDTPQDFIVQVTGTWNPKFNSHKQRIQGAINSIRTNEYRKPSGLGLRKDAQSDVPN
jgi:predicted Zn finger-like uncharacterized protein